MKKKIQALQKKKKREDFLKPLTDEEMDEGTTTATQYEEDEDGEEKEDETEETEEEGVEEGVLEDQDDVYAPMDFDVGLEIPVKIRDRRTKKVTRYILRECAGGELATWKTGMRRKVISDSKGNTIGVKDFDGVESGLIALCLWKGDEQVTIEEIEGFDAHVQAALFTRCQKLCGLDVPEAKKRVKNS